MSIISIINQHRVSDMAIGSSGRIVIDLTPEEKSALHAAVRAKGLSFKSWVLQKASEDFPELTKATITKK